MQRKIAAISPLALLTLTACGGGSSGGGVTASLRDFAGNAVKGPLQNAFVFLDLDGDELMRRALEKKATGPTLMADTVS